MDKQSAITVETPVLIIIIIIISPLR